MLDRPATLARVVHEGRDLREFVAFGFEGASSELTEPGPDNTSLHPQVRDGRVVDRVLGGLEQCVAFGESLHHAVLDGVVHHLDEVASTDRADVEPTRAVLRVVQRRQDVEDLLNVVHRFGVTTDHHAVADLQSPDTTTGADIDVADPMRAELLLSHLVVGPLRVTTIDDDVAGAEEFCELVDGLLCGVAGRHHDPHRARRGEVCHQLFERVDTDGTHRLRLGDRFLVWVVRDGLVRGVALDPLHHVPAHTAEADHTELHCRVLFGSRYMSACRVATSKKTPHPEESHSVDHCIIYGLFLCSKFYYAHVID